MSTFKMFSVNQSDTDYEFIQNCDGQIYYFQIKYNKRNDTYYLTVLDSDRSVKLSGVAMLTNVVEMLHRFALDDFMNFGEINICDVASNKFDPSFENFGDIVNNFYSSILTWVLVRLIK